MLLSKRCDIDFKAYSVSKELGDKAAAYSASSNVTEKKFRNIVSILFRTR